MRQLSGCHDAVFDVDPEPGRPPLVSQPGPPPRESRAEETAAAGPEPSREA